MSQRGKLTININSSCGFIMWSEIVITSPFKFTICCQIVKTRRAVTLLITEPSCPSIMIMIGACHSRHAVKRDKPAGSSAAPVRRIPTLWHIPANIHASLVRRTPILRHIPANFQKFPAETVLPPFRIESDRGPASSPPRQLGGGGHLPANLLPRRSFR
jgi:hypothetical protein